jgi:tetratricopeptide (TPR) repeat protein
MSESKAGDDAPAKDVRPYVVRTYDRWIILVIVLVGGWFLFRPIFAYVTMYRGITFETQLVEKTAEHYYRKSIAIDPKMPDGWIKLGELYYFWSYNDPARYEAAAQIFASGEQWAPDNYVLPWDLGRVYLVKLHRPADAEAALRESLKRNPESTPDQRRTAEFSWDYLAYAALETGDVGYARRCWQEVLRIDPGYTSARDALRKYRG